MHHGLKIRLGPSTSLVAVHQSSLILHWTFHLSNHIKYLGVAFDRKITWRIHVEKIEAKAFRTFLRIYSLFRSERLRANIKLTLHNSLIESVVTYAWREWEFAADTQLLKLKRLQQKVLVITGKLSKREPVRDLHVAFKIPYDYDLITKFCRRKQKSYRMITMQIFAT
jgi:hypothetical protein